MKIYIVKIDNGEPYEDNHSSISSKSFKTFRNASVWLIREGFEPYHDYMFGKSDVRFYWEESDDYMADCKYAEIMELELSD